MAALVVLELDGLEVAHELREVREVPPEPEELAGRLVDRDLVLDVHAPLEVLVRLRGLISGTLSEGRVGGAVPGDTAVDEATPDDGDERAKGGAATKAKEGQQATAEHRREALRLAHVDFLAAVGLI